EAISMARRASVIRCQPARSRASAGESQHPHSFIATSVSSSSSISSWQFSANASPSNSSASTSVLLPRTSASIKSSSPGNGPPPKMLRDRRILPQVLLPWRYTVAAWGYTHHVNDRADEEADERLLATPVGGVAWPRAAKSGKQ